MGVRRPRAGLSLNVPLGSDYGWRACVVVARSKQGSEWPWIVAGKEPLAAGRAATFKCLILDNRRIAAMLVERAREGGRQARRGREGGREELPGDFGLGFLVLDI